jgi:iron complex outermembrane receptor protein
MRIGGIIARGAPIAILVTLLPVAGPARAQQPTPDAPRPVDLELPAVTVTARKRDEREQSVPISMTVLEGSRLDVAPTASNAGLARSAPNVSFTDVGGQSSNLFSIRGVGSFSPISADDTSTVLYVNEAPQSLYGPAPSMLDVDRVEVLRGPQGTLFGRNTQAGAVSIVPKKPTYDWRFVATGELGTSGFGLGEFVWNAPLVADRLAARVAMRYSGYAGDVPNIAVGGKDGAQQIWAGRGTVLFEPTGETSATLSLSYNRQKDTSPRFLLRNYAYFPTSAVNPRTDVDSDSLGVNLKVRHDFDWAALESVTTYQNNYSRQILDPADGLVFANLTGLPASLFNVPGADLANLAIGETIFTQEVRLSAPQDSAVAWTAGLNYFRSTLSMDRSGRAMTPAFATIRGFMNNDFVTNSWSAFGEATVPVADRLKATLGLRGTLESKTAAYAFNGAGQVGVVPFFNQNSSLSDNFVTGRGGLSYDWTDSIMTYLSIARGYVTAGFPSLSVNAPLGKTEQAFPASTSWTYEAGFKSEFAGKRMALNGAFFFNDVKQGHLVVFDPSSAAFTIAALDYQSYGAELEVTARPLPGLELFAGLGLTRAMLVNVPPGSATGALSGNTVPNAPGVTATVGAQYRVPASIVGLDGDFVGHGSWQYVGTRAADVANSFNLDAYSVVNLRVGWKGKAVEFYGFAYNLFDQRYQTWGQSFGPTTPTVRVGQGQILGLGSTVRF